MPTPILSVVIPVFNEEECIPGVLEELRLVLDHSDIRTWECLVVDDGSTDSTAVRVAAVAAAEPRIRLLRLRSRSGQTAAFDAGIRAAQGELVGTMDGDGQNDPRDFERQVAALRERGVDMVCGVRAKRADSWLRKVSSRVANGVRNRATRETVTDVGCSIRVFRRACMERIKLYDGLHRFFPTLFRIEGYSIAEIPVNHRPRDKGQSKYGVHNRLWRGIRDLIAVRWMMSRSLRDAMLKEDGDR